MLRGFKIGFNIGSRASHVVAPAAAAVLAAYGGHEVAHYLMEKNARQTPEHIQAIVQ